MSEIIIWLFLNRSSTKPNHCLEFNPFSCYKVAMLKKLTEKIAFLLILTAICTVQADAGLEKKIDQIRAKHKKVDFAIKIVHAKTGTVVYQNNPKKPMTPASNMKIVTSAAALKYLGPDYRFTTKIGLLDGALVVIGGGDPLLGDEKTDNKYGRENGWIFQET